MWHYLCHTRQRSGDQETMANRHGFLWLREFKRWRGPNARVGRIPEKPPRPYKRRASAQRRIRRRKVYASPRPWTLWNSRGQRIRPWRTPRAA
jgi:hypothetical protein